MSDWQKDSTHRFVEMEDHANQAAAHLKSVLARFMYSDDDGLFDEADDVIGPVIKWIEEEAPWL